MISVALKYASQGIAVLRIQPGTKIPFEGSHGVHDATRDESVIRSWPEPFDLAMACGKASGVLVVDIDPRNGGEESWCEWAETHGHIDTRSVFTGGNGAHLHVKWPGERDYKAKPLPGVDILGNGRYALLPPSSAGAGYRWLDERTPIAEASPALLELITRKPAKRRTKKTAPGADISLLVRRARSYIAKMPAAISGQGGHDATFAVARTLVVGFRLPTETAYDLLTEYNERCQPRWSERELRHKVESAAERSTLASGYLMERAL